MKKTLISILICLLVLSMFSGCSLFGNKDKDPTEASSDTSLSAAPTTLAPTTTITTTAPTTTVTTTTAAPTTTTTTAAPTTTTTTTTTEQSLVSDWEILNFVDEFGDDTDDKYIDGVFYGTFSNSATSGSNLTAEFLLAPSHRGEVRIILWEYNNHQATFSDYDTITVKTKDASGKVSSYTSDLYDDDSLCIESQSLLNSIVNSSELSFSITVSSDYHTVDEQYVFKINNVGLKTLYDQIY